MEWLTPLRAFFNALAAVMDELPLIRAAAGSVLIFFVPGFAWTLAIFGWRKISFIERMALSFGISVAVVVLSIITLNLAAGVRINGFNSVLIIMMATAIPMAIYLIRWWMERRGGGDIEKTERERENDV